MVAFQVEQGKGEREREKQHTVPGSCFSIKHGDLEKCNVIATKGKQIRVEEGGLYIYPPYLLPSANLTRESPLI
jgi:hypothetical protein